MATHKRNVVHVSTGNDKHMWKRWVIRCVDVMGYDRWLATINPGTPREDEIWQWVPTLAANRYFSKEQADRKVEELRAKYVNLNVWAERIEDTAAWVAAAKLVVSEIDG